jgi:Kef-type K+ transport system membrane component KefB|tara:strand:- start:18768 stop:20030 length:1263 start_codon:yes stop_codon:yes gene_type:complete
LSNLINTPSVLIALAAIVIVSYLFNLLAKKTRIPSVLMLLGTGIILGAFGKYFDFPQPNVQPSLEILGSIGLIMIVLEAALDLEFSKDRRSLVGRSFILTLLEMGFTVFFLAGLFHVGMDAPWENAILYAVPLSILSSAIVIPSIEYFKKDLKEFMIYQSTFSDILGIMLFYFLVEGFENPSGNATEWLLQFGWSFGISVIVSAVFSYLLVIMLQNIKTQLKLFLLISALILLYAVGKLLHLSSLLVILIFGMILNNPQLFFPGRLRRLLKANIVSSLLKDFKLITRETAFIVRTFFFVVFGYSIDLSSLGNPLVIFFAVLSLIGIYQIRKVSVLWTVKTPSTLLNYLAPRGLITILLFYAIPANMSIDQFDNGILLYIILVSSSIMAWGMVRHKEKDDHRTLGEVIRETGSIDPEPYKD